MSDDKTPTENTAPATPEATGQTVPFNRFQKKVEELKTLKGELSTLQQQFTALEATATNAQELQSTLATEREGWSTKEALYQRGINDSEHQDLARYRYGKSGATNFGEWLDGGAQSDAIMKAVLNQVPAPAVATSQAAQAATPGTPTPTPLAAVPAVNNGTRPAPPPRSEISADALNRMTADEKAEIYPRLAEQWGFTPSRLRRKK